MSDIRSYSGFDDPRHQLMREDGDPLQDGYADIKEDVHQRAPTDEELQDEVFAPGEEHFMPLGVQYQGEWRQHADGLARAIREQVLALASYVPVRLEHIEAGRMFLNDDMHPEVSAEVGYLPQVMFKHTAVAIRQIVFQSADYVRRAVLPASGRITDSDVEDRILKSTIVYTSWERDCVHDKLIREIYGVGELWVPCADNLHSFVASGFPEERVVVMPHTYNPATHLTTQIPWPRGSEVAPNGRRFYNIGKWEPRKNQHELIGAFLHAFTPKDRVALTIKTHGWGFWDDYPPPEESLEFWANEDRVRAKGWTKNHIRRCMRLIVDRLTDAEIADLHKQNNIYVSASHGEAWDIPAFDALCAGNSLVHVGYGGTADYADDASRFSSVVAVPHEMGPVHEGYRWEDHAQWGVYDHDELVAALQRVKPPVRRIHPPSFPIRFGRVHVGRFMLERILGRVRETAGDEVANQLAAAGAFG